MESFCIDGNGIIDLRIPSERGYMKTLRRPTHVDSKGIFCSTELDNQFRLNRQIILIPMFLPDRALLQQNLCSCIMTELFIYIISEQVSSLEFHFQ
jgi:hypothetical protein